MAAEIVVAAILGGFAGLLAVALYDPFGHVAHLDTAAIVIGAVGAVALVRRLRR